MLRPARVASWCVVAAVILPAAGAAVVGSSGGVVANRARTAMAAQVGTAAQVPSARRDASSTRDAPPALARGVATTGPHGASSAVRSQPPPPVPPCPTPPPATPGFTTGTFCGPAPAAGDGDGPAGECTGAETVAPCGSGAVPGRYYDETLPGGCTGLVLFDGRKWVSELPPPVPEPPLDVWIALATTGQLASWIAPTGAVGLRPDVGQPLPACSTSPPPGPRPIHPNP